MANEEQRKAFAAYMGGGSSSTASVGQQIPPYPGSVANPASQYLFNVHSCVQQFPGLGVPPAVPTPPPAAASSVASYQGFQGGFQGGFPPQAAFGQAGFPQRLPPLGQGQNQSQGQPGSTQLTQASPGYAQLPREYASQPPPPTGYNTGWQYTDPRAPLPARTDLVRATSSVMAPVQRNVSTQMFRKGTEEYFAYQHQAGEEAPLQNVEQTVPVLLCHTCSDCGQMRSAGFHRNHPVIPGKPIVTTPCRKCKKRSRNTHRSRATSYARVRTCRAEEPCDWPREPVHVDIDYSERRGRRRDRDEVYASWGTDHLRPRIVTESSSRANLGLRSVQRSPPREYTSATRVRVSSFSPERSRYAGVWPRPDVVGTRPLRSDEQYHTSDEVWPPPDVIRTHSYRKKSPLRVNPRIIELSPSPPPQRSRTTRVHYRQESEERRPRSPVRRSESRVRMQSHPRPYRTVIPERRVVSHSDDTSTNDAGSESANRGILKPADMTYETSYRRRTNLRDSQQSTNVEVGGPRVQFATERRDDPLPTARHDNEKHERHLRYERRSYVDEPASPPIDRMERLHIRHSSPSPQRAFDEIRVDRARRISPSPPRRFEEVHYRHVSVSPKQTRERALRHSPSPPPHERSVHPRYRHVSRTRITERARSLTPPPIRRQITSEDDMTDSEDEGDGPLVEVRSWKGIDENGQPATFVEERRKPRLIDQGSIGGSEFRPLSERLSARSYREIWSVQKRLAGEITT
ncbi:hypothetical protein C7974DRAFT_451479 [Boeremia exigua]|uniref:uncharacterized protein n=1 Tax=Boeremia exigua TaxID=749465 RepID=UPI001E8E5DB6|nr:uncharacterized protein C7974DRAFT_451479 [Boeremia exigua]KAH6638191.1 hypothetical protein C7974DRAFT_451479 [Boeremia exigua]